MKIHKIVLTGGSNGGKTELIKRLLKDYRNKYTVAYVPETATQLLDEGVTPDKNFQEKIAYRQLINEFEIEQDVKEYNEMIYFLDHDEKEMIIFYDRSFLDQLAYCNDDEWQEHMSVVLSTKTFDESIEKINKRYDLLIHLESNAKYNFVTEGRLETQEEAVELEKRTLQANMNYRELYFVPRTETIDEKYEEVKNIIDFNLNNEF